MSKPMAYIEECPEGCGMFNCPRCWEAGAAMMAGYEVHRTESYAKRRARWLKDMQEDDSIGNRRGRTMDLPFRYEQYDDHGGFVVINGGKSTSKYRAGGDYNPDDTTPYIPERGRR